MSPIQFVKKTTSTEQPLASSDISVIETWCDLNILGHAQLEERDIGSRCGGHGICGGDRVQLLEGDPKLLSGITAEERKHLSEEELGAGFRLACQCFPNSKDSVFVFSHD